MTRNPHNAIKRLVEGPAELTKYSSVRTELDFALGEIRDKITTLLKLPVSQDLKDAAKLFIQHLERYTVKRSLDQDSELRTATKFSSSKAAGRVYSSAVILQAIKKATGKRNWRQVEDDEEYEAEMVGETIAHLYDDYGIEVTTQELVHMAFERETDNRSALAYVSVWLFPGGIYIQDLATDRVSGYDSIVKTPRELEKEIRHFSAYDGDDWE